MRRRAPRTTRPARATCPSRARARRCRAAPSVATNSSAPGPEIAAIAFAAEAEITSTSSLCIAHARIGVQRRRAPRGSARGSGRAHVNQGAVLRPPAARSKANASSEARYGAPAAPGRSRGRPRHRPRSPGGARLRCRRAGAVAVVIVGRDIDDRLPRGPPAPHAHGSRRAQVLEAGGVAPEADRRPHGRATWALEVRSRLDDRSAAPLARRELAARDTREQPSPSGAVEHAHDALRRTEHAHERLE